MIQQRLSKITATKRNLVAKKFSFQSTFGNEVTKKLTHQIHFFLLKHNLVIRMQTRTREKLHGHLLRKRKNLNKNFEGFLNKIKNTKCLQKSMFVIMNETAICFETKSTRTVQPTGCSTKSVRDSEGNNQRLTTCIAIASDGTKLQFFFVFKVHPIRHITKGTQHFSFLCK